MNNYIDERFIPYKNSQMTIKRTDRSKKGSPLTRKQNSGGIVMRGLEILAVIFLLVVSTFGGDVTKDVDMSVGALLKKGMIYAGAVFALWMAFVIICNVFTASTQLPFWSLIAIFALAAIATVGVKHN